MTAICAEEQWWWETNVLWPSFPSPENVRYAARERAPICRARRVGFDSHDGDLNEARGDAGCFLPDGRRATSLGSPAANAKKAVDAQAAPTPTRVKDPTNTNQTCLKFAAPASARAGVLVLMGAAGRICRIRQTIRAERASVSSSQRWPSSGH